MMLLTIQRRTQWSFVPLRFSGVAMQVLINLNKSLLSMPPQLANSDREGTITKKKKKAPFIVCLKEKEMHLYELHDI